MDREINDKQYKEQLDRYITGNYGEDQFKNEIHNDTEILAEEMWEAWVAKHKEFYPEIWSGSHPIKPPTWEEMSDKIKQCWIAAASHAMKTVKS